MILPHALTLERYRAFGGRATLPLRPITLVYGGNNAGKSALLRALALLGASLEPGGIGAVRLPTAAMRDVRFQDLAWQGEAGNYRWRLGLQWGEGPIRSATWTLNGASDVDPFIARLEIAADGLERPWIARENEERRLAQPTDGAPLAFAGLTPEVGGGEPLDALAGRLGALRGRIRWLSGVRAAVPRSFRGDGGVPGNSGDGVESAALLARDPALLDQVARFYRALDLPRELLLHEVPLVGHYLSLNPAGQPGWRVNIADTGEGMAQVLPVLTQAALSARVGGILAIEEPESHLHPNAQRVLAQYLCALVQQNDAPRLILETHSRVFLLAVQLAVAGGLLPPEKVAVVWVDQGPSGMSTTTVVSLRANGRLGDGWPASALGEDMLLARELTRLGRAPLEGG